MTTEQITALDEEITILEDLDFELECEVNASCPNKVTWLATLKCCGREATVCDKHRQLEITTCRIFPLRKCLPCGFTWDARDTINVEWTRI